MNISPKERYLDICHFKRPGDLCMSSSINLFWEQTLGKWVEQGAPKEIINPRFRREYFQFPRIRSLTETKSSAIGEGREEVSSKIDLGHGITVGARTLSHLVPAYEPRII